MEYFLDDRFANAVMQESNDFIMELSVKALCLPFFLSTPGVFSFGIFPSLPSFFGVVGSAGFAWSSEGQEVASVNGSTLISSFKNNVRKGKTCKRKFECA